MGTIKKKYKTPRIYYEIEPVYYCKQCLSLRIMGVGNQEDLIFCDDCNSTDIGTADVRDWEQKYITKYGINFLKK